MADKQTIIEGELTAFLTNQYTTVDGVINMAKDDPNGALVQMGYFHEDGPNGWVPVGKVKMVVTLDDPKQLALNTIATLRQQQTKLRADTERELNQLEGKIQRLLALSSPDDVITKQEYM